MMIVKVDRITDLLGKPREDRQHKAMIGCTYRFMSQPFYQQGEELSYVTVLEKLKSRNGEPSYGMTQTSEVKATYYKGTSFELVTLNSIYYFDIIDPCRPIDDSAPWHSFPATKEDKTCSQNFTATQTKEATLT